MAFHTANYPPHTFSSCNGQRYPGARLLWKHVVPLHSLVQQSVLLLSLDNLELLGLTCHSHFLCEHTANSNEPPDFEADSGDEDSELDWDAQ